MIHRLLWNDIRNHKLMSLTTVLFMAASAMLISLAAVLFTGLLGSVDRLMTKAQSPDYLQMHTGAVELEKIADFAADQPEIEQWQVMPFLNLENNVLELGEKSLSDSTQDNGLCVQGERFDYLLGLDDELPVVKTGEVYVPICYRSQYDLCVGDQMQIGSHTLTIAGFIRDSQMNSMLASSKRFLVDQLDYERLKTQGEEEYLIEFLLHEGTDTDSFAAKYGEAQLYANGPAITKPLIKMMNALSDGIMILVILLVAIVVLLISLLCIRFIVAIGMEQDKKEVGMLKAVGIGNESIVQLYFSKYLLLSGCGAVIGMIGAKILEAPLSEKLKEMYGTSANVLLSSMAAAFACLLVEGVILLFVRHILKKLEQMTALQALFTVKTQGEKEEAGKYIMIGLVAAACGFLALIPQNLSSTMSAPDFVTYMGIGDAGLRMDVRMSEQIEETTDQLVWRLGEDPDVANYVALKTVSYPAYMKDDTQVNLMVEIGDHSVFPVSYAKGKCPEDADEIALSSLLAQELCLKPGDLLDVDIDGCRQTLTVCGIYSDITNGGKTAKVGSRSKIAEENVPVMWSILYVTLKDTVSDEQWMSVYSSYGVDIVNIADYVQGTYGATLKLIELARRVALGVAAMIVIVVIILFMRLVIETKRYGISLKKALGFTARCIQWEYLIKGMIPAVFGVFVGILLGNTVGGSICGLILKSLGADGFRFVVCRRQVLLIAIILVAAAANAIWLGIREVKKIKAYECCMRKE